MKDAKATEYRSLAQTKRLREHLRQSLACTCRAEQLRLGMEVPAMRATFSPARRPSARP
jgi:hypothetical protein